MISDEIKATQMPLVSVIVPVYNTEDYLEQCLTCLCEQTLSNIEIIVIDNASTDRSGQICDAFAAKDTRFKVIHKRKNEGVAVSRNDGVEHARAKYIMWVDSDDWVEPEFCEVPYYTAEQRDADLVVFKFQSDDMNVGEYKRPSFPVNSFVSKKDALTIYWPFILSSLWNKMFRRELFEDIHFPVVEAGRLCEDTATTYRVIYHAEKIFLLDKQLYHYRESRPGSITGIRSKQYLSDYYYGILKRIDDLKRWGYECSDWDKDMLLRYLRHYGMNAEYSSQCKQILQECKNFSKDASWKKKTMFRLFRISPKAFDRYASVTGQRYKEKKNY